MIVSRISSIDQYVTHREKCRHIFENIWKREMQLAPADKQPFTITGISYPANATVDFLVDFQYSNGTEINWRERLICPVTGLNSRLRACVHFADFELSLKEYHDVYITEQVTPLYRYFKEKIPGLTGSEFVSPETIGGTIGENSIRHEDMTRLSFSDESFDFFLSFECYEHIPDFYQGFKEAFRVLKKEGVLFFSVPFVSNKYDNTIRAIINEKGELVHHLPPEFHGNPMSTDGSLCFTHFGWEMLDQLRSVGFLKVYAILYWGDTFGYMGGEQILFYAGK